MILLSAWAAWECPVPQDFHPSKRELCHSPKQYSNGGRWWWWCWNDKLSFNIYKIQFNKWTLRTNSLLGNSNFVELDWFILTYHPWNSDRMVVWIKLSVSKSTAAVASSRTRIFVFLNKALARQISCLCPTDRFSPPSATSWSSPDLSPIA